MRSGWAIGSGLAAVLLAGMAAAQQEREAPGDVPDILLARLNTGAVREQFVAQQLGTLRAFDRNNDGLDRDDVTLAGEMARAQARANSVGEMLAQDLNGDFKVTREEMLRVAQGDPQSRIRHAKASLERFDTNGDGVITLAEAAAGARDVGSDRDGSALLAIDPNRDGRLTVVELQAEAERTFDSVDRNGDRRISAEEYAVVADRIREINMLQSAPACAMPEVPAGARLLVYGGYDSNALSSASIGGSGEETGLVDVRIEAGSEPLYLVLTSYESLVWRFSGATGRVAHVVVSSHATGEPRSHR